MCSNVEEFSLQNSIGKGTVLSQEPCPPAAPLPAPRPHPTPPGGALGEAFPIISDDCTEFMFRMYLKLFGPNSHINCSDQKRSMSVKFGWIIRQHSQDQEHVA